MLVVLLVLVLQTRCWYPTELLFGISRCILGVSRASHVHLMRISGVSRASHVHLMRISCVSQVYLMCISGVSQAFLMCISCVSHPHCVSDHRVTWSVSARTAPCFMIISCLRMHRVRDGSQESPEVSDAQGTCVPAGSDSCVVHVCVIWGW